MANHLQAARAFAAYLFTCPGKHHFPCTNNPQLLVTSTTRKMTFSPESYHWVVKERRWYKSDKPIVAEKDIFGVLLKAKYTPQIKVQWTGVTALWKSVSDRYSGITYLDVQEFLRLWRHHNLDSEPMSESIIRLTEDVQPEIALTQDWTAYSVKAQAAKVSENQAYLFSVHHWLKIAEVMRLPKVWTPPGSPLGVGDCKKADADLIVLVRDEVPAELALDPETDNKPILIVGHKSPSLLPSSPASSKSAITQFLASLKDHATIDVQNPSFAIVPCLLSLSFTVTPLLLYKG